MNPAIRPSRTLFFSLVFLLFFQLVSDFIETVYTFGLLSTSVPPEVASILLFFSPLLLLFFRKPLPLRAVLFLAALAGCLRALEATLDKTGRMLAAGLGIGCLLVMLPASLSQSEADGDNTAFEMGSGAAIALVASILLRTLGTGSDITSLYPWLSWLLLLALILLAVRLLVQSPQAKSVPASGHTAFGATVALCLGVLSALAMLYFAFTSPGVLARWSGLDGRLLLGVLVLALAGYCFVLDRNGLPRLSPPFIWAWNALFVLAGTAAILVNQVHFPAEAGAYPFDQPEPSLFLQIPLLLMILLSPVILLDTTLLLAEIKARRPSQPALAGGFALAALFFLVIVVGQVLTTVYDYVPVVGPWFRDRFWLVFLLAGLGTALPALLVRHPFPNLATSAGLNRGFLMTVSLALAVAFAWTLFSQPHPPVLPQKDSLRVVTYNIQQGYSLNGSRSYVAQLAVLKDLQPDLLGLQESDVARFSGGNADIVRYFAERLGMYSYYGPRTVTGTFGIALLSRYPIENPHTFFMYSTGEQTAAIQAMISANGQVYTILVTHLGNDGPPIQQQEVLYRLQGQKNIIALGDYNFDSTTPQYALTLQSMHDAWVQAGSHPSAGLDMQKQIDHIFVSPGTPVLALQYLPYPASDHPALFAEIGR
jgi:endonuclease/exonuclease/phosphatase family metal-dependent hydrolase